MKRLLILLFSLWFYSCADPSSKESVNLDFLPKVSDNPIIYGSWTMCAMSNGFNMIQMNVCPAITFLSSGIGQISMNGFTTESFHWSLNKNNLLIFSNQVNPNSIFPDTNYYARFDTLNKPVISLKLSHNLYEYYLSANE